MNINYVKKYSNALSRDMEYKTYGTEGHPVLVFPSQDGRFYDYQDFDMVGVLSGYIDHGLIRLICVDSIDRETWSDMQGDHHRRTHPRSTPPPRRDIHCDGLQHGRFPCRKLLLPPPRFV